MSCKYRPMATIGFTALSVLLICAHVYDGAAIISIAVGAVLFVSALLVRKIREQVFPFFIASALLFSGALYILSDIKAVDIQAFSDKEYALTGRICDKVRYSDSKYYYTLDNVRLDGNKINSKLNLSLSEPLEAKEFDEVEIESVKTYSVGKAEESVKLYYNSKDIYLGAYVSENEAYSVNVRECIRKPLAYRFLRANVLINERILEKIPNQSGAIAVAMLTGNKDYILPQTVKMYTDAGIAPLFAVSGFHLSLWVMGLFEILRSFGVKKRTNSAIAIITTVCFMALTGFSASVCRAGIMLIVLLAGNLFYRDSDSVNSLGLAVIIMCIANPMNVLNIGFLLSVTATLGIVILYPVAEKYILSHIPEKLPFTLLRALLNVIFVCVTAVVGAFPVTVLFIGKFSVMTVFSNVAVSFVAGFCMLFGGLTVIFYPLDFVSDIFAFLCEFTAKYIYNVISFVESLNISLVPTSDEYWRAGAIICSTIVVFSVFFNKTVRKKINCISLSVAVATCGVLSFSHYDGLTQVDFLDVGGSILMIASDSSGKAVVCDESKYGYYSDELIERLGQLNSKKNEMLLIPTYEASLSSNVVSILKSCKFEKTVTPYLSQEIKRLSSSETEICRSGCFEVLNSGTIYYLNESQYSVALCCFDTVRILVIFRSNKNAEILSDYLEADILVCSEKLPECVDVTQYNEVIISAGEKGSESIYRYVNEFGVPALTTSKNGDINIQIKNQDYKIVVKEGV